MFELHEARHEGAAGEAVGPVQPPDPGAQHVPQELELPSRPPPRACRGRAQASRRATGRGRGAPPCPRCAARTGCAWGEPSPSGRAAPGGSRSPREQVAHLLGVGLPVQAREARLVQPAQPRAVFGQGDRHAGAVGHGQRHCEYEIQLTGSSGL